ncbi:uncharacterized protein LOC144646026 [Oculina patagonica]
MSDLACFLLLALTAGSLVPATSTVLRRSLTCEEQLEAVSIDPAVCGKIRSAVRSVRHAVVDIDVKISKSATESIEKATAIMGEGTKKLKEQLPKYLEHQEHDIQGDLSSFHDLASKATSDAVQAVKDGSKEIRDALFNALIALNSSPDNVSEAAKYVLEKVISKRSTREAVSDAIKKVDNEVKESMQKAVVTALGGFKDLMNNMEMKIKALIEGKVPQVDFLEPNKKQIEELAIQAAKALVAYYDSEAMKSVNKAIIDVHDLLIAVYAVQTTNPGLNALFTLRGVVETESQAVKDAINLEEANPERDVAQAMKNAVDHMVKDYNDIVQLVNNA